jgi:hypothetical protein
VVDRFHKINRNLEEGNEILTNWIKDNSQNLQDKEQKYSAKKSNWRD